MPETREEKLQRLKNKLTLATISLTNAEKKIKDGKVVTAAVIDDLTEQKAAWEKEIARLEASPEEAATSPASSPQPASTVPATGEAGSSSDDYGIPQELRIPRRPYTMSEAARAQRRKASTSPAHAEAMKGNQNAWKTGEHAQGFIRQIFRPCKSTCGRYPCQLIEEGSTEPGEACLDKEEFMRSLSAMQSAVKDGKADDIKDLAALRITGVWEVVRMLTEDVLTDNTVVKSQKLDKEGNVIGHEIKPHPSLLALGKLVEASGLTAPEWMVTPREIARNKVEKKKAKTMADIMSNLGFSAEETPVETEEEKE